MSRISRTNLDQIDTAQCYRSAWQYASTFFNSLPTSANDSHIVALHQVLIPNWTSSASNKFLDATRALVDELANITTTKDGKEEMMRCEEVFRQICWLEERFWPVVDDNGDESGRARIGGPMPAMGPTMDNTMGGSMLNGLPMAINGAGMHTNTPGPSLHSGGMNMHGNPVNGNMGGPIHNSNMHGQVNNTNNNMNGPMQQNGPMQSGPMHNGPINAGVRKTDSTPVSDNRNHYGMPHRNGMDNAGQGS